MGNIVEVNIGILEQDTNAVDERMKGIKDEFNKICDMMVELDGTWKGQSEQVFMENYFRDKDDFEELLIEADKLLTRMKNAVKIYRDCEITVGQEVDEIVV